MDQKSSPIAFDKTSQSVQNATDQKPLGFGGKCRLILKNVTVEPLLIFTITPSVLSSLAVQNLNLEKACRVNLAYPSETCDALSMRNTTGFEKEEIEVQQLVAWLQTWKSILQSALPTILIVFLGAYSDRTRRRKPCMLLPLFGEVLMAISLLVCTHWFYELSMEFTGFNEGFWPAVTGGWFTLFMGVYSYVGDVTDLKNRTVRIGIVSGTIHLSIPIGLALSGILYVKLGFYGVFSIALVCYTIGLAYGIFFLKEVPTPQSILEKRNEKVSRCKSIANFLSVKHIAETFRTTFRKTKNKRHKKLAVLMCIITILIGQMFGEMAVLYLFTRHRFNWTELEYSYWSTYSMVINLIGCSIAVGVFSHTLHVHDALIGIVASIGKIGGCLVYAFAHTNWHMYVGPLVELPQGAATIAMRSIISKLVPPDELGQVNSLYGLCESLTPLIFAPVYALIYRATLETIPGAFFIVGAVITIPAVFGFIWLYLEREVEENEKVEKTETDRKVAVVTEKSDTVKLTKINMGEGIVNAAFESEKT